MSQQYNAILSPTEASKYGIDEYAPDAPKVELTKINPEDSLRFSHYRLEVMGKVGEAAGPLVLKVLNAAQGSRTAPAREARRAVISEVEAQDEEKITWLEQAGMSRLGTVVKEVGEKAVDFIVLRGEVSSLRAAFE